MSSLKGEYFMAKPVLEINANKPTKLKFENVVTGTDSLPSSFLTIKINEDLSLQIRGKDKKEDNKLISEIIIPPVDEYFKKTTLTESKLWIQVANSIFTPWKSDVKFIEPISVEACKFESDTMNLESETNVTTSLIEAEQDETIVKNVVENNSDAMPRKSFNVNTFKKNII